MALKRGDIVEVYFDLPKQRDTKTHPAIIISNQDVYDIDDCYVCVMMTSSEVKDKFTFVVEDNMLERANNKSFSQARCHLITYVIEKHLIDKNYPKNTLKPNALDKLIAYINEATFSDYD